MKKLKRFLTTILACTMAIGLIACGGSNDSDNSKDTAQSSKDTVDNNSDKGKYSDIRIGVILPLGGLGDNAIADDSYRAVTVASEELGFKFDYSEPVNEQDRESMIIEYSESGEYDLVMTVGTETVDLVQEIQPSYPEQKYFVYDTTGNIDNTITETVSKEELGFMAGAFMALMDEYGEVTINGEKYTWTPSGKIGIIVGQEYPSTIPAMTGAAAGAKYINPDSEYMYGIVGSWTDQAKNKELALSMYEGGCNFVFHNAGAGSSGIVTAAEQTGKFMIGYDADQNVLSDTNVMASSRKNNEGIIVRVLTEFCENDGELEWGSAETNGYADNGAMFTYNEGVEVPEDVKTAIEDIQNKLVNREIEIPTTWEEVDTFTDTYTK